MKKIACLLTAAVLFCVSAAGARAADTVKYDLPGQDVSLEIPSDLAVFSGIVYASDPNLAKYALSKETLTEFMQEWDLCLLAIGDHWDYDIRVSVYEGPEGDLQSFGASALDALKTNMPPLWDREDYTYAQAEIFETDRDRFMKEYFTMPDDDSELYGVRYYTFSGGTAVDIALISYTGPVQTGYETAVETAARSLAYTAAAPAETPSGPAEVPAAQADSAAEGAVSPAAGTGGGFPLGALLLIFLLSAGGCLLPAAVFRYAAMERPVGARAAVIISAVWGLFVFCGILLYIDARYGFSPVVPAFSLLCLALAGLLTYKVLSGGGRSAGRPARPVSGPVPAPGYVPAHSCSPAAAPSPVGAARGTEPASAVAPPGETAPARFCRACGSRLLPDSLFCSECGAGVNRE